MELDNKVYEQILELSKNGEDFLEDGDLQRAILSFTKAIDLLPEPKSEWDASEWLHAHLGDAYYELGKFGDSLSCFQEARNAGDEGDPNPYILLRMGACLFRLGDKEQAAQYLIQAFMLEGERIFSEEPDDITAFLHSLTEH
jgi:tetratricopeptide (TPR) repeat protein